MALLPEDIGRLRLRTQRLVGPAFETPEAVVRFLGAVQSQELALAKWSVAARTKGATEAALDRALEKGTILRTHILRPTWHFVLPEDIRWLRELTSPRVLGKMRSSDRELGLTEAVRARSRALIRRALAGGAHRTRGELAEALGRGGIPAAGRRLAHLVLHAELEGVVCSGKVRGKQQTYALLEERTPRARSLDRDEALALLVRRYFTSHGPATVQDLVWWSSLTSVDVRRGLEIVGSELERAELRGRAHYFAQPPRASKPAAPRAHLLQAFDEYLVAYGATKWAFDLGERAGPPDRGRALYLHTLCIDGQVAGRWRRVPGRDGATIEVRAARRLGAAEKSALAAEVERHARFLGAPVRLRVTR